MIYINQWFTVRYTCNPPAFYKWAKEPLAEDGNPSGFYIVTIFDNAKDLVPYFKKQKS